MARRILEEGKIVYQYELFQNSNLYLFKWGELKYGEHKNLVYDAEGEIQALTDTELVLSADSVIRRGDLLTLNKSDLNKLENWLDNYKEDYGTLLEKYNDFKSKIQLNNINVLDYLDETKEYIDNNFGYLLYFYPTVQSIVKYMKNNIKDEYNFIGD